MAITYTDEQMRQLLTQYGPTVYRLAMAQLHSSFDAEDVYQEVFLKYLRAKPVFQNREHQKAWFIRVTINCCKDHLKKACRRDLPLEQQMLPAASPNEEYAALHMALTQLKEPQRAIIHLHYYEGYKTKEIAELLEINHSTVLSHLRRASKKLKKLLEGEEF